VIRVLYAQLLNVRYRLYPQRPRLAEPNQHVIDHDVPIEHDKGPLHFVFDLWEESSRYSAVGEVANINQPEVQGKEKFAREGQNIHY
jgi:hypothetical protein